MNDNKWSFMGNNRITLKSPAERNSVAFKNRSGDE